MNKHGRALAVERGVRIGIPTLNIVLTQCLAMNFRRAQAPAVDFDVVGYFRDGMNYAAYN